MLVVRRPFPIEDVVLNKKDHVEQDRYVSKKEFQRVPRDPTPVRLQARVQNQLRNREHSAGEVQDDLSNVPTHGGLPLVVHPRLRDVLDHRDDQFDV